MKNEIIPYRKDLKEKARELRKNSTLSEVLLWQEISQRQLGVQFHRQVPLLDYIVDFYCHELKLAIEVNGDSHEYRVSYDAKRESRLNEVGVKVLVYDDLDVKQNIKWVVNNILGQINENRHTPNPSHSREGEEFEEFRGEFEKSLKLKVCGMRDPENLQGLISMQPDFIGFIFYPKSSRYAANLDEKLLSSIPKTIGKVGVFVNEGIDTVCEIVNKYKLDYVQLHGDEDLEYAMALKSKGVKIVKVFRVTDRIPEEATDYAGIADYLLFDTATSKYGGSGKQFDWNILKNNGLRVAFLLSGGIQLKDIETIKTLKLPKLEGIDVNSGFELEPGLKDLELIKELKRQL